MNPCEVCNGDYPCGCVACPKCSAIAARNELGHACTACDWRSDRCTCGALMTFDPDMRGTSCGGLALVGFRVCVPCGVAHVCKQSRPADAVDWKLAKGGRSLTAGGIKVRCESGASAADVEALMARLVRLPDLEAENEELRRELQRRSA